jgi:hypothetical protein
MQGEIMLYEFITDYDWFNREGPFLFNLEHILFIIFYITVGIVLAIWLRKKPKDFTRKVLIALWIFTVAIDIPKWSASWYVMIYLGRFPSYVSMFPLYTCSLFMYITPIALFAKNEKLQTAAKNFTCTMMLPLGFVSIFVALTMTYKCSIFSFYGFHTVLYHSMMYIVSLAMLVSGYYKPQKKDICSSLILFAGILALVYLLNCILKVDYMYIYDGSTFTVLSFIINALPHRLVWTLLIMIFYFSVPTLMHFIILKIQSVYQMKKLKKEEAKACEINV